ncbi:MAG TPA: tripartite tricarboxylate transporter substrate binding protein [Burkholderiales bacterium]|nr:tripartite tricarboxylate transporter substrate binding protein [Burkholderiales bacterium]
MSRLLCLLALLCGFANAGAQAWPSHPVRMVIPLSPGGFADVPGRMLAARLSAALGQNVFVENRPGAGGTIGADAVAKSAPDGYTLLFTGTPHVIAPWIYKKVPYEALNDFEPVALVASGPYVLVANPQLNVHSVRELIAAAKAQPGKIDYASSGNGSAQHLVSALFASTAGIELNHVPYKGSGPAMQDLLGGRVKLSFAGIPNVLPQIKAGRLVPLAVSTPRRSPDLPEVPTVAEAGVPGFQATLWLDLAAPRGTSQEIVQHLTGAVAAVLKEPEIEKNFRSAGVEPTYLAPAELASFMQAEYEKWGRVVRQTGATVN